MGIIRKQSIIGTIITYLGIGIGFITTGLLYPKFLTVEQVGLVNLINAFAVLFAQLATLGVNSITTRLFPYFKNTGNGNNGYLRLLIIVPLIGFIIYYLLFLVFKQNLITNNIDKSPLFSQYYYLVTPLTLSVLLFIVGETLLMSLGDAITGVFLKEFLQRLIVLVSLVFLIINLINFSYFIHLYVIANAACAVLIILILLRRRQFNLSKFRIPKQINFKDITTVSFFGILSGVSTIMVMSIDRIMINKFLGLDATGIYSIAFFFGTIVLIPSRPLKKISIHLIAESWKNNNVNTINEIYKKSCINQFIVGLVIFLLLWINLDNIFNVISPEYEPGKYVILLIAFANLIDMATGVNANIISMSKYYKFQTYFNVILIILLIATNLIFIPAMGINGAAIATLISITAFNLARYLFLLIKFKFQPFNYRFILVIIIGTIVLLLNKVLPIYKNLYVDIVLRSTLLVMLYSILILFLKVSDDINMFLNQLTQRIRKKK